MKSLLFALSLFLAGPVDAQVVVRPIYPRPVVQVPAGSVVIRPLLPWRPLVIITPTK